LVDPSTKKPTKVGFKVEVDAKSGESKKVRVSRKTGKAI
jgi:hypothetical protein